jgi:hypothetical protein
VAEAAAGNGQLASALKPQIIPGLIGGFISGLGVILNWLLWKPSLPQEFVARSVDLNRLLPLPTRLLYGGFTEELLLRWGLDDAAGVDGLAVISKREGQAADGLSHRRNYCLVSCLWFGTSTDCLRVSSGCDHRAGALGCRR